jgi:hypothetical protein
VKNRSSNRICGISVAAALLLGLSQSACLHGSPSGNAVNNDQLTANDQKQVERVEKMRARALNAPGGALEASDFAFQVTQLFVQGVATRRPVEPTLVDEAVGCLDKARQAKPDEDADLLARKGEMLLAAGRVQPGVGSLRESISERPNLRAFTSLTKYYTSQKQTAEVEALCKRTLPAITSDGSRYALLDECLKASGAATPEAGLRWAPKQDVAFYKARKKELEARVAAAKQQRAKEEKKEENREEKKEEKKEEPAPKK